ncbi:MAG: hypothetical protein RL189_781, partial [Pseudomonadota bacterium]
MKSASKERGIYIAILVILSIYPSQSKAESIRHLFDYKTSSFAMQTN